MEIELTRELRQAIDETRGEPVYIVDSDRHETFVLLTSADFDRVRPMLGVQANHGQWTDDKNRRRVELIDRKIAGTITILESMELARLQEQAEAHFDQVAPPPMRGVTELHRQLLSRDSQ